MSPKRSLKHLSATSSSERWMQAPVSPGLYELRLNPVNRVVYVGHSRNLRERLRLVLEHDEKHHLHPLLKGAEVAGFGIDFRWTDTPQTETLKSIQTVLTKYNYAWNRVENGERRLEMVPGFPMDVFKKEFPSDDTGSRDSIALGRAMESFTSVLSPRVVDDDSNYDLADLLARHGVTVADFTHMGIGGGGGAGGGGGGGSKRISELISAWEKAGCPESWQKWCFTECCCSHCVDCGWCCWWSCAAH